MIIDYWYWQNFFSLKQIKQINNLCKRYTVKGFKDRKAKNAKKTSNVTGIFYKNIKKELHNMHEHIKYRNQETFGYNLFSLSDHEILNYNEYSSKNKGQYEWHIDHSGNYIYDSKFTVLINTSEEKYEGGKFNFFYGKSENVKAFDTPGTVLIFKSHMHHQVTPVTKGKRSTLTLFLKGPKFV
jgi:predicted 2-oxoglutarate/Fe(II)-dependent dioxygenase YbiX